VCVCVCVCVCELLTQYLPVADNEGDDVLLHVSASSERQE